MGDCQERDQSRDGRTVEEGMEPFAVTCENGRSVVEYSEGSFFSFRFRHGLSFL